MNLNNSPSDMLRPAEAMFSLPGLAFLAQVIKSWLVIFKRDRL